MKLYKKEDLKDSRIFFDKMPPKFMSISVIFLLLVLIISIIVSSQVKKPYIVKGQGQVAIEGASYITSKGSGVVTHVFKEPGDIVQQGEDILAISSGSEGLQASALEDQIQDLLEKLDTLDTYEASLVQKENRLKNEGKELEYYAKVQYYLDMVSNDNSEKNRTKSDLNEKKEEIDAQRFEKRKAEVIITSSEAETQSIEENLSNEKNKLKTLNEQKNINELEKEDIQKKIAQLQEVDEEDISELTSELEEIKSAISKIEDSILEKELSVVELQESKIESETQIEEWKSEVDMIDSRITALEDENKGIERQLDSNYSQVEQTLYQLLSELGLARNQTSSKLIELQAGLGAAEGQDAINFVKASESGELHFISPIAIGMAVQQGQIIGEVASHNEKIYVDAYISASDRSRVKVDKNVNVAVIGLNSYRYGTLPGKITFIEPGTVRNETVNGVSILYRLHVELDSNFLESNSGETVELIRSMPVEARIVYNEESYLGVCVKILDRMVR
jgi:membrane fusion protein, peptide pheromone/bacteriocin exporter